MSLYRTKYTLIHHLLKKIHLAYKEGQFDVVELMDFSINLNAQHVNGMTHYNLIVHRGKIHVRLLDAL